MAWIITSGSHEKRLLAVAKRAEKTVFFLCTGNYDRDRLAAVLESMGYRVMHVG
jgi:hypothetical protein